MLKFWKKKETPAVPAESAPAPVEAEVVADATAATEEHASAIAKEPAPVEAEAAPARRSWRERLSGSAFARGLSGLFARNPKLDDDLLDELETCLLTADVGIGAATEIVDGLRKRVGKREFADANALLAALRADLARLLAPVAQPLVVDGRKPFVLLMVGVNGVGKTPPSASSRGVSRPRAAASSSPPATPSVPPRSSN